MVIDGSMVGIGLLEQPLEVKVKDGVLQSIQGKEAEKLEILLRNRKENFQLLLEYFLHEIIFTKQERKDV